MVFHHFPHRATRLSRMSEAPKKKTPAKKQPQKKAAPKKPAAAKPGTAKRGRPKKVVVDAVSPVHEGIDEFMNALERSVDELEQTVDAAIDRAADEVIIRAKDIKKRSLRERMLKWFK